MAKKSTPHCSITFRAPIILYDLLGEVAAAERIDRSAVIVQLLSRHLAELQARAQPAEQLLAERLRRDLGEANAALVLALAGHLGSGPNEQTVAEITELLRQARQSPEFTLTNEQAFQEALAHRRALSALEEIRHGQAQASQG